MPVTDEAIETAVSRLSVHCRGSFASAKDWTATALEYARCLERMPWCDDDLFLYAVDEVIDGDDLKGFLPSWHAIRKRCWARKRSLIERDQAAAAISDTHRRAALPAGPTGDADAGTIDAAFKQLFGASNEPEQSAEEGRPRPS